jgi:hypothetical protein
MLPCIARRPPPLVGDCTFRGGIAHEKERGYVTMTRMLLAAAAAGLLAAGPVLAQQVGNPAHGQQAAPISHGVLQTDIGSPDLNASSAPVVRDGSYGGNVALGRSNQVVEWPSSATSQASAVPVMHDGSYGGNRELGYSNQTLAIGPTGGHFAHQGTTSTAD